MIRIHQFLAFTIVLLVSSCSQPITFSEPQPPQTNNLAIIPKRLHGEFVSLENNSVLTISDKLILQTFDYDYKIHRNELDSSVTLKGDTLYNLTTKTKTLIRIEGDSIVNHINHLDTIFKLNAENVIRKFKGYYFLNVRYNLQGWEVKKISLTKGKLVISKISSDDEIKTLESITETPEDTVRHYEFKATKKQFVKFIKSNGFQDKEEFIRQ